MKFAMDEKLISQGVKKIGCISFFLLLLLGFLQSCNTYEDGPAMSLRSKSSRMRFTRPITYYTVDGIDSLAGLNKLFQDSIPGFVSEFNFEFEYDKLDHPIYCSDCVHTVIGTWSGIEPFDFIGINLAYQPFDVCCWEITRLTHRQLWLRSRDASPQRELRFEE